MFETRDLSHFKCEASNIINIKLISETKDIIDNDKIFHPEFTHQIFGESESIFGYKDLNINLYYCAHCLYTYFDFTYELIIDSKKYGVEPDDINSLLLPKINNDFTNNMQEFKSHISKCKKSPFGICIDSFNSKGKSYETYMIQSDENMHHQTSDYNLDFYNYYQRLQIFTLWYIDAASYIDLSDSRWRFFMLYETINIENANQFVDDNDSPPTSLPHSKKLKTLLSSGESSDKKYDIVGFANVYEYFAYPNKIRPRISQFLVMPMHTRLSLGTKLLRQIYSFYRIEHGVTGINGHDATNTQNGVYESDDHISVNDHEVVDIAIETPSYEFNLMRDFVDCEDLLTLLKSFPIPNDYQSSIVLNNSNFGKIIINDGLLSMVHDKLKLNKKQISKIIDILNLYFILRCPHESKADEKINVYKTEMRDKMMKPFLKENEKLAKFKATILTKVELQDKVEDIFKVAYKEYQIIADKLLLHENK
ncbi:unnamed protein product [Gordionus sp. m RMFG-2023]|uniref:histone acetyltransferase type B catalytic subunit-like n=1 Tax=Gordionus sp. m RMFG-2023 TaxID=3053472 RepID=UPI0030DF96D1